MQHSYEMFYTGSNPVGSTMVYEDAKVYGPYPDSSGSGRKIVFIIFPGDKRTSTSYARYLMECHLDRYLTSVETVDHKDDNYRNDSIDNLQILTRSENIKKSKRVKKMIEVTCAQCNILFTMELRNYRSNQVIQGRKGPYCSRECVHTSLRKN